VKENGRAHVLLAAESRDRLTRSGHSKRENKAEKIQCQREKMGSGLGTADA
jgi:hypothetical protein